MQPALQKIILFLFLLPGYFAGAQVKFSASITPSQIGKDEFAQLKLTVENAREVQQINPPQLKDFVIVSGPNQESGMSVVNGNVNKYIALSYIIKPKGVGSFSIPPAMAKADGVDYKSNRVDIKVTTTGSGNNNPGINSFTSPFGNIDPFAEPAPRSSYRDYILRKGENPSDKINKNMFVKLEVDKTSCYVGEPIVATYKLYTRLKSESSMTKNPSFNGFSVIDLQQQDNSSRIEKLGGREYNVYNIRKVQLYPLLAGNLELGTAEIENNVHFIKAEYVNQQSDIFNDLFQDFTDASIPPEGIEDHRVTLQNKPVTILVKPLPDVNKPANFKGAVGNFQIEARVEKNNFSTDDAGKLAMIISGVGNLQMVNAPEIAWPEGIEGFDPKATDDLYKTTVPLSGRKIFEFPFTVSKPGTYTIPALEFSFFNVRDLKYKTVNTKPLQITVTKGTGKPKKVSTDTDVKATDNYLAKFFNNRLRVVSIIAVLIIIGLIIWLKRENKNEKQSMASIAVEEEKNTDDKPVEEIMLAQQNPLALAEDSLQRGDGKIFYIELNQAFKNYLSKKLSIPPEELNKKNITEQLDRRGVTNETAVQLHQLMDEIEWQLYTPFTENEKMKTVYERANELIQLLNTYRS
ncbi:MAG: BatD family protein [Ferruginibacter sp.]